MADSLWNVGNLFYLGAYQSAINEAQELHHLRDNEETERDFFMYRSYVALKKYELVLLEIKDNQSMSLLAVKLLAQYLSDPSSREAVLQQVSEWMKDGVTCSNPHVCLIAGTIYANEVNHVEALKACHTGTTLEMMALTTQVYLQMHRIDKAEQQIKVIMPHLKFQDGYCFSQNMSKLDDDATITQLATAWVDIRLGGAKIQEAFYIFQELGDKFKWTSALHNGSAVCNMLMGRYDEAERDLLDALNKQPNDADTLANLAACQLQLGKPSSRYIKSSTSLEFSPKELVASELKTVGPNHVLEKMAIKAEDDFDRAASAYA